MDNSPRLYPYIIELRLMPLLGTALLGWVNRGQLTSMYCRCLYYDNSSTTVIQIFVLFLTNRSYIRMEQISIQ